MAVVAALLIGFVLGARDRRDRWSVVALTVPFALALLEILWNAVRFGWTAMIVWAPVLVVLTIAASRAGAVVGAAASSLLQRGRSPDRRPSARRVRADVSNPNPVAEAPQGAQAGGAKNSSGMPSGSRKLSPEP